MTDFHKQYCERLASIEKQNKTRTFNTIDKIQKRIEYLENDVDTSEHVDEEIKFLLDLLRSL